MVGLVERSTLRSFVSSKNVFTRLYVNRKEWNSAYHISPP